MSDNLTVRIREAAWIGRDEESNEELIQGAEEIHTEPREEGLNGITAKLIEVESLESILERTPHGIIVKESGYDEFEYEVMIYNDYVE